MIRSCLTVLSSFLQEDDILRVVSTLDRRGLVTTVYFLVWQAANPLQPSKVRPTYLGWLQDSRLAAQ